MSKPLYNFMPYDNTPPLVESITKGNGDRNCYGSVIARRGAIAVRSDGEVFSVWAGDRLEVTSKKREICLNFARALVKL